MGDLFKKIFGVSLNISTANDWNKFKNGHYPTQPSFIFRAWYFGEHKEFNGDYYEFEACTWREAVERAEGMRYKCPGDGLAKLEIVAKTDYVKVKTDFDLNKQKEDRK